MSEVKLTGVKIEVLKQQALENTGTSSPASKFLESNPQSAGVERDPVSHGKAAITFCETLGLSELNRIEMKYPTAPSSSQIVLNNSPENHGSKAMDFIGQLTLAKVLAQLEA
ncbi:MAG: hypothetical protein NZO16_07225 [Deltaproteobacteria bacterium]|nr:hypothetical protein [Deltaproteobacteria bacterium]